MLLGALWLAWSGIAHAGPCSPQRGFSQGSPLQAIPPPDLSQDIASEPFPLALRGSNALDGRLSVQGGAGDADFVLGGVDTAVSGPLVRNRVFAYTTVQGTTGSKRPTPDGSRDMRTTRVTAGMTAQPTAELRTIVSLGRQVVDVKEGWWGTRERADFGVRYNHLTADVRTNRWRVEHPTGAERTGQFDGLIGWRRPWDVCGLDTRLAVTTRFERVHSVWDRTDGVRAPLDRTALAAGEGVENRVTVALQAVIDHEAWQLLLRAEGVGGQREQAYLNGGGRFFVLRRFGQHTVEFGGRRALVPVGPGLLGARDTPVLHRGFGRIDLEFWERVSMVVQGSAEQFLGVDTQPLERSSLRAELGFRRGYYGANVAYVLTHADARFTRVLGVDGLAIAASTHQLEAHAKAEFNLLLAEATLLSDFDAMHDVGVRVAIKPGVRWGSLELGVSGENLLAISDGLVGEAIDERWAWTGRPRPRRVEVDLSYRF